MFTVPRLPHFFLIPVPRSPLSDESEFPATRA